MQLHDTFAKQGLQVAMHTQLYGVKGSDGSAAAELTHDKDYFIRQHGLGFPIGVDTTRLVGGSGGQQTRAVPASAEAYGVNGIPHLVVIDKSGVIRQIYVGWLGPAERSFLDTNAARITTLIEKLVAEPTASTGTR